MLSRPRASRHGGRLRRTHGSALVEFALVTPLLLVFLAGILNYGLLLRTASCVSSAARAGARYGSVSLTNSLDTAGIQSAAANSVPGFQSLTVTSARTCNCSDGTSVSCSGSCGTGSVRVYIQVTASASRTAIFSYSGLPFSGTTSTQALMRVQ